MKRTRIVSALVLLVCIALTIIGCSGRKLIGEEKAKELAFEHFELNAADCTVIKIQLDEGKYELEFVCAGREYDVEIDAYSGAVREMEIEKNDIYTDTTFIDTAEGDEQIKESEVAEKITVDRAEALAIAHFGLNAEECTFIKAEHDEGGYEIEFVCGEKEYEVKVGYYTGEVIETDVDSIYD